MAKINIDKKDIAKSLFLNGAFTQEEIAAKVGTTRQTVSRWMKDGGWEEMKASLTITPDQIISQIHRQIMEINNRIGEREPGRRFATPQEADALEKTLNTDYDKNRLEQELIYYIEKLDVNEEKQRLGNHLKYFINTLETGTGQGKKLGFIAQEMGREINTLGSKSNHAEMQKIVVQMKDELEQIKEQVLNVM